MESRNLSLRLPLPTLRRPPMHRRTTSSSSEASSPASPRSNASEDQFVLSPNQTPAHENPPSRVMASRYAMDASAAKNSLLLGKEINTRPRDSGTIRKSSSFLRLAPSIKSNKPIVIDLAKPRRAEPVSASSSIPPEPLSARGDVPGGYFPLHEDPDSRLRIPHPFQLETDMARQGSLKRAAESSKSGADPRPLSPASGSLNSSASVSSSSINTPISSYNPSGLHDDVVLPMGKYYPSNWEKRHGKAPKTRPTTQPTPAPATKSEPQAPKHHTDQAHPRPGSDIKRRLQQYQRDMVAQAAMSANALIANNSGSATTPATTTTTASSPLGGDRATLPKAQLAAAFFKAHKPLSPRLRPVGSPGPVTPMSLEADCYLALGSPVGVGGGLEADFSGVEMGDGGARAAGKGKQRRKDSCPAPPAELSTASI